MAKRFFDSELWQKEWFQDLSVKEKILTIYIFENCDCAGIWNGNFKLASFLIGESVTIDDLKTINDRKFQFEILPNGNIFIPDFIIFQYGTLSENCKPHKPIIEKLKKLNLYERVSKGFPKGFQSLEEKEIEKEKEIVKIDYCTIDYFADSQIDECLKIYEQNCPDLPKLMFERKNVEMRKLTAKVLTEIDRDIGVFKNLCIKANKLKVIVDKPIDYKKMLNCYQQILNGAYEEAKQKTPQELYLERMRREQTQC